METQTTAQTLIPTIKLSDCKIVGIDTETHESNSKISYSDICGGFIKSNPNYATVTVKSGLTCDKLKEFDIVMIDTEQTRITEGCIFLFEYHAKLLIRELQIMLTSKPTKVRSVFSNRSLSDEYLLSEMQVIGRVVGTYTPFGSESVQY